MVAPDWSIYQASRVYIKILNMYVFTYMYAINLKVKCIMGICTFSELRLDRHLHNNLEYE